VVGQNAVDMLCAADLVRWLAVGPWLGPAVVSFLDMASNQLD